MKAGVAVLLFGLALNLCAQNQLGAIDTNTAPSNSESPTLTSAYSVTSRGANSRVWQRAITITNVVGETATVTNSYTELGTGLHYWNGAQWAESSDQIQITPYGAAATNGQHQVTFAANINTAGAIDLLAPDGQHMRSHITGLAYFDASTSNSVMIAELQDSIGQLLQSSNQVIYTNAFTDFQADVRYTYRVGGLEQDIILRQQPPPPSAYGMNAKSARIQIWTEFTEVQAPQVTSSAVNAKSGLFNQELDFGAMKMTRGNAFGIDGTNILTPVAKHWSVINGRSFLVEEVPLVAIAAQLQSLPPPPASGNTNSGSNGGGSWLRGPSQKTALASLPRRPTRQLDLPPPAGRKQSKESIRQAAVARREAGLVLDYAVVNGTLTNLTFQGDITYLVSNTVYLYGKTTIEGGTVIKFNTNWSGLNPQIVINSSNVVCSTGPYRPAIFTARDDDSVGEIISGSTGNPTNVYRYGNGNGTLMLNYEAYLIPAIFKNLRFANLGTAVGIETDIGLFYFYDSQFVHCDQGFMATGQNIWAYFYNVLFHNGREVYHVPARVGANGPSITGINVTIHHFGAVSEPDDGYTFADDTYNNSAYLSLANSLLTSTSINDFFSVSGAVITNNTALLTSDTGVFQTVGAGSNYLADGSIYHGAGTTNIDATVLADLRHKTTYPPIILSNVTYAYDTVLSPQAQRETGTNLDLGYHYDPLDFIVDNYAVSNATVTIIPGTVIACYNEYVGIGLEDGSTLVSTGTPQLPNWFTHYTTVQEQPISIGSGTVTPSGCCYINPHHLSNAPSATYRFSKFTGPSTYLIEDQAAPFNLNNLVVQDCEFWGAGSQFQGGSGGTATIKNCLFVRSVPNMSLSGSMSLSFSNNLVWGATLGMSRLAFLGGSLYAFNNIFDTCTLNTSGTVSNGYNAYLNTTTNLSPSTGTDYTNGSSLSYQTGPMGTFYQPTNSSLINLGNTNANLLGLYHYTTQTNQVKETNSFVDIGYHYVAVNGSGIPIDTDGDGLADYFEDTNGSGTYDSGSDLANWQAFSTSGDGISDDLKYIEGRSLTVSGATLDTSGIINLNVYTPLK